jgi:hypothetical protein
MLDGPVDPSLTHGMAAAKFNLIIAWREESETSP